MRYRLRTLLILLAVGPPVLALSWWLRATLIEMAAVALAWAFVLGALILAEWLLRPRTLNGS
jgi:hypothetical protein